MMSFNRSSRRRELRPVLVALEDRKLLNAAMPHVHELRVAGPVHVEGQQSHGNRQVHGQMNTLINRTTSGGFAFTNFDGPNPGTNAGQGTNMNGIANSGTAVGFTIETMGTSTTSPPIP